MRPEGKGYRPLDIGYEHSKVFLSLNIPLVELKTFNMLQD